MGEERENFLTHRQRRRHYNEIPGSVAGDEGEEQDELLLEQLRGIKFNSLKEWIDVLAISCTIMCAFKEFLKMYIDKNGTSVYGQRIKTLGKGTLHPATERRSIEYISFFLYSQL